MGAHAVQLPLTDFYFVNIPFQNSVLLIQYKRSLPITVYIAQFIMAYVTSRHCLRMAKPTSKFSTTVLTFLLQLDSTVESSLSTKRQQNSVWSLAVNHLHV